MSLPSSFLGRIINLTLSSIQHQQHRRADGVLIDGVLIVIVITPIITENLRAVRLPHRCCRVSDVHYSCGRCCTSNSTLPLVFGLPASKPGSRGASTRRGVMRRPSHHGHNCSLADNPRLPQCLSDHPSS